MIEQDLLGISVNDLIENYCVLYDQEKNVSCGITTIRIAEKIDKAYGNVYEERYVFLDIFAADSETIKKNKILSYFEVQKQLELYIGWVPDPEIVDIVANCVHDQWSNYSKEATQLLLDLFKIIKNNQELISDGDVAVIQNVKYQIDEWRNKWGSYFMLNEEEQKEEMERAKEILQKLYDNEVIK